MEEAANGPWYFKQNEDGVFVKLDDKRIQNKRKSLMEEVLEVKEGPNRARDNKNSIAVSFFLSFSTNYYLTVYGSLRSRELEPASSTASN